MSKEVIEYAQSLLDILNSYGTDKHGPIPVGKVIQVLEETVNSTVEGYETQQADY